MARLASFSRFTVPVSGVCKVDCNMSSLTVMYILPENIRVFGLGGFKVSQTESYAGRASKDFVCPLPAKAIRNTGDSDVDIQEEELDSPGVWDSNAENIRTNRSRNFAKRYPRESGFDTMAENWTEKLHWRDANLKNRSSAEWDYNHNTDNDCGNSKWWSELFYDESYPSDDEEDEFVLPFSLLKQAFSMLGWMFPASFILLPWLLGNHVSLMMVFLLFPVAQKAIGPILPDIWRFFLKSLSSMPKSNKDHRDMGSSYQGKASPLFTKFDSAQTRKNWRGNGRASSRFSTLSGIDELQGEDSFNVKGTFSGKHDIYYRSLRVHGWEELEESKQNTGKLTQGRMKEGTKQMRRREVPLFSRFVIALFPFLRSWGGFL